MDADEEIRAAIRKRVLEAAIPLFVARIKSVRDGHAASAAHHRAEAERLEREAEELEAELVKLRVV